MSKFGPILDSGAKRHSSFEMKQRTWHLTQIRQHRRGMYVLTISSIVRLPYLWETEATMSKYVLWKCVKSASSRSGPARKVYKRMYPRLSLKPRLRRSTYRFPNFCRGEKCEKFTTLSITQPQIYQFRSNLVCSLPAWHLNHCTNYCTRSRSMDQKSRSQCDVTVAKYAKLLINQPGIVALCSHFVQTMIM